MLRGEEGAVGKSGTRPESRFGLCFFIFFFTRLHDCLKNGLVRREKKNCNKHKRLRERRENPKKRQEGERYKGNRKWVTCVLHMVGFKVALIPLVYVSCGGWRLRLASRYLQGLDSRRAPLRRVEWSCSFDGW